MYQQNLEQEELVGPISSRGSSRAPLSDAEKLRKVIRELVDTERTYVEVKNEHVSHITSYFFILRPLLSLSSYYSDSLSLHLLAIHFLTSPLMYRY